jgi:xylan 1,4-beta-xylosidase
MTKATARDQAAVQEVRGGTSRDGAAALADWEDRIYRRTAGQQRTAGQVALAKPARVRAVPRAGHIELSWEPVPGAAGYLIERTEQGATPQLVSHGGSDVAAVAGSRFADTGLADGPEYTYRIGAVTGAEYPVWSWSEPVSARTAAGQAGPVTIAVDAASDVGRLDRVWRMIGAERLSQLLLRDEDPAIGTGGGPTPGQIAAEFAGALRMAHDDLGATMVRAHAILHDDNGVVSRDPGGVVRYDFARVDAIYDQLLELGLRPVVELSFMPAALARDPDQTVFTYRAIVSPPADWDEWRRLVAALTTHLVDRYGIDEVASWAFEVWNEPNLEVFWSGTAGDYLRLYAEAAAAVKSVDTRLRIGGPATAAGEWIEPLVAHAAATGMPLDFVSTHTYGNLPLDLRPALRRHGLGGVGVWWTEWGIGAGHFGDVHDGVLGAPFVLSGLLDVQGRADALAYWVISDHFEELGRPPRLFHNGFGLLSVGNLRKPRYWAVHLAQQLGDRLLAVEADGDGAGTLVRAWAARRDDGTADVLIWNGTINVALRDGDARLDRRVQVRVEGMTGGPWQASLARVDELHSNIARSATPATAWPDGVSWHKLREEDRLHIEPLPTVQSRHGIAEFTFDLPMPGIARIRLEPPAAPQ